MKRIRDIAVFPTMFTLANLLCGFFAIVVAARIDAPTDQADITPSVDRVDRIAIAELFRPGEHQVDDVRGIATYNILLSSWLIFFAMLFDMLDGRVARLTRQTSDFGGQLDSLCDLVTFGVAPAFLMVKMCGGFTLKYNHGIWFIAAVYAACAALRLARFNVENDEEEDHLWFAGLPVPAAAAAIAGYALALYTLRIDTVHLMETESIDLLIQYGLPVLAVAISLLMVSRIPYPHAVSHLFRGRRSFAHVVALVFALIPVLMFSGYVIPALASIYALAPAVAFAWRSVKTYWGRRQAAA